MSHATFSTLGSGKFSLRSVENGNSNVGVTVRVMPQPMLLLRPATLKLRGTGVAALRRPPQYLTDFGCKLIWAERLLYKLRSRTQDSDIDRGVLCVGRHIKDLQIRPQLGQPFNKLTALHARHKNVRND